jgi:RimJ/RimL family protein N-acetyltransferase
MRKRKTGLTLDALVAEDVPSLASLAGDRAIADTTISVPHPLDAEVARQWLASLTQAMAVGSAEHFAIREAAGTPLVGMVSLRGIDREHEEAELSFWIGRPFWGRGYATEAAGAAVDRAFDGLGINRIVAHHMVRNPASGRVLARLGFRQEGLLRERVKKWGVYEDVVLMALLRRDRALDPSQT